MQFFVDDLKIFAESPEQMQRAINVLDIFCDTFNFTVNKLSLRSSGTTHTASKRCVSSTGILFLRWYRWSNA